MEALNASLTIALKALVNRTQIKNYSVVQDYKYMRYPPLTRMVDTILNLISRTHIYHSSLNYVPREYLTYIC